MCIDLMLIVGDLAICEEMMAESPLCVPFNSTSVDICINKYATGTVTRPVPGDQAGVDVHNCPDRAEGVSVLWPVYA